MYHLRLRAGLIPVVQLLAEPLRPARHQGPAPDEPIIDGLTCIEVDSRSHRHGLTGFIWACSLSAPLPMDSLLLVARAHQEEVDAVLDPV